MAAKSYFASASFIKALCKGIAGYRFLNDRQQFHFAQLIWEEGIKRRVHKTREGYISIGHRELERRFGRGRFKAINEELGIFETTPNWYHNAHRTARQNSTKGYRLSPQVQAVKDRYLKPRADAVTRLVYLDSKDDLKTLKSVPEPIASKEYDDPLGVTATAWRDAKPFNRVPVDLELLRELDHTLNWLLRPECLAQNDLFLKLSVEKISRCIEWVRLIIRLAQTDIAGRGHVIHRYAECRTGRLYARGMSLQTAPRLVRKAALHGLYDYDIENCHYAIFDQLAARFGYQAEAVRHYLIHKREVREGIASRVGIRIEQAKMCLLALMFGARTIDRPDNAIPTEIGSAKARMLYRDTEFSALAADVKAGREVILDGWPKRRTTLLNDLGKKVKLSEKAEVKMAHIIQGIEAMAIRAAIDLYPDEIVLLMHDGFVTTRTVDVKMVEHRVFEETGYRLQLSGGVIVLPPDLEFSKF